MISVELEADLSRPLETVGVPQWRSYKGGRLRIMVVRPHVAAAGWLLVNFVQTARS